MRQFKSCGVLLFRQEPALEFLLLQHVNRLDLPKGHVEAGEDERATAHRELAEETGYGVDDVALHPTFRHESIYHAPYQRFGGELVEKTLVIFLARLLVSRDPVITEHRAFRWTPWKPPHRIQSQTLDGLLQHVEDHFKAGGAL